VVGFGVDGVAEIFSESATAATYETVRKKIKDKKKRVD
jgi:hypothetical protein